MTLGSVCADAEILEVWGDYLWSECVEATSE